LHNPSQKIEGRLLGALGALTSDRLLDSLTRRDLFAVVENLGCPSRTLGRESHCAIGRPGPILANARIRTGAGGLRCLARRGIKILPIDWASSAAELSSELGKLSTNRARGRRTILLHESDNEINVGQLTTGLGTLTSSWRRETSGIEIGRHSFLFCLEWPFNYNHVLILYILLHFEIKIF